MKNWELIIDDDVDRPLRYYFRRLDIQPKFEFIWESGRGYKKWYWRMEIISKGFDKFEDCLKSFIDYSNTLNNVKENLLGGNKRNEITK